MAPDFAAGAAPVTVISEVLWRELFGRSDQALGAPLFVNGRAVRRCWHRPRRRADQLPWRQCGLVGADRPGRRVLQPRLAHESGEPMRSAPSSCPRRRWPLSTIGSQRATADLAAVYADPWRRRVVGAHGRRRRCSARSGMRPALLSRVLLALSVLDSRRRRRQPRRDDAGHGRRRTPRPWPSTRRSERGPAPRPGRLIIEGGLHRRGRVDAGAS